MKGELLDNNKKKNMNIRLEDEREKNKKLKMMYIIIIAVCIVAVVATGIIQIVKNLPDKEPEIDTSILQRYKEDFDNIFKNQVNYLKNSGYKIDRIDESQQIVYTGYSNKSNKVSDYNLDVNIPYINTFRPHLSSRLTWSGRTFLQKPEAFGHADSHCIRATHSGILTSIHSTAAYATVSPRIQRSPTQCTKYIA